MIVSTNWLEEYVTLDMKLEDLTHRLTMSGLNLEDVAAAEDDEAIDLEVTSNRPDCLGHIGVAREIGVLFDAPLTIPPAELAPGTGAIDEVTSVQIECEDLCPRYTARVIRGVKIGPSPDWLVKRLETAHWDYKHNCTKYKSINNVVDLTNYVMLECGQPLHAFDLQKLGDQRIVVRRARGGEKLTAINQTEYELDDQMCVIADSDRPVAIGGVMGGLDTEISDATTDVLIEAAAFAPLSVRRTARKLKLFSPSSFRFERTVDRNQIDWAGRRCCELILRIAGGTLVEGCAAAGAEPIAAREAIPFRFDQVSRVVGLDVSVAESTSILASLGLRPQESADADTRSFAPPSWRSDLTREIDLVEEVARIHGYEKIDDNMPLPTFPTAKTRADRITERIRDVLIAMGFFDCMTLSFLTPVASSQTKGAVQTWFNPRGLKHLVTVDHSTRGEENVLRASIVPGLLACRRDNERQRNSDAELFEIARVYLAADTTSAEEDVEPIVVSGVSGRDFSEVKGVVQTLATSLHRDAVVTARPSPLKHFHDGRGAELMLNGRPWGWLGELCPQQQEEIGLRENVTVFELGLQPLVDFAELDPTYRRLPDHPAVSRDLNFVLEEAVTWEALAACVRESGGALLKAVSFGGQYRGPQIDAGRKSYIVTNRFQSPERTLTAEEVDAAEQAIVKACADQLKATLRA